jgi:hypothetical protein
VLPTTFKKNIEPALFAADDTRPAPTDQHDQLRVWQAVAIPAAGVGIGMARGYYVPQSHFVTSLEVFVFMTPVTSFLFGLRPVQQRWATLARCRGERYQ